MLLARNVSHSDAVRGFLARLAEKARAMGYRIRRWTRRIGLPLAPVASDTLLPAQRRVTNRNTS